jgi:hypothetical protein
VHEIYPATRLWRQQEGVWLLTRSLLLPGLARNAVFLIGICYAEPLVRSWGFWIDMIGSPAWIGPRHTNFPDGSICAFEPSDQTWVFGDSIVKLLDIYTLWAIRHLHLELFGRWPGYQAVSDSYERILEIRGDEHCGCSESARLYRDCCQQSDLARDRIADAVRSIARGGGQRQPPEVVRRFVNDQENPPRIAELLELQ